MIPARVLAIGAHPDDIELYAGGTIATWADDGAEITFLILTDGRLGSPDPTRDPEDVARARAAEAIGGASRLGAGVTHLAWPDGALEPHRAEATMAIVEAIRALRPDIVVGHDPWRLYELHPDHRAAGLATCDAVVAAREHRAIDSDAPAHRVSELWLVGTTQPDHFVDVTASMHRKLVALGEHVSQFDHVPDWRDRVTGWNAAVGAERGFRAAEAFRRLLLPGAPL